MGGFPEFSMAENRGIRPPRPKFPRCPGEFPGESGGGRRFRGKFHGGPGNSPRNRPGIAWRIHFPRCWVVREVGRGVRFRRIPGVSSCNKFRLCPEFRPGDSAQAAPDPLGGHWPDSTPPRLSSGPAPALPAPESDRRTPGTGIPRITAVAFSRNLNSSISKPRPIAAAPGDPLSGP